MRSLGGGDATLMEHVQFPVAQPLDADEVILGLRSEDQFVELGLHRLAVAVLGVAALGKPLALLVDYGGIPVALLTALSGAAYLTSWLRHMAEQPEGDQRP